MTFARRTLHQLRTDARRLRVFCLVYLVWLVARTVHLLWHDVWMDSDEFDIVVHGGTGGLMACLAAVCVWGDAPSNTDTSSLSRPMGQGAAWLGKVLFALLAIILPVWFSDAVTWTGFGLSWGTWVALSAGSVLSAGMVVVLGALVACMASSYLQGSIIATLAVIIGGTWWFGGVNMFTYVLEVLHLRPNSPDERYGTLQDCGRIVGCVILLLGSLTAWWLATVPRRRWLALAVVALALFQKPVTQNLWRGPDWLAVPEQRFPKERLALKTGKADPNDKAPGRGLWSTLRLGGLKPDESPSILAFGPENRDKTKPWPPLGSYGDLPRASNWPGCWMPFDHLRVVSKHFAATDLWTDNWHKDTKPRPALTEALKPLKLDPPALQTTPGPWRLRLAVHEMKKIAELPLRTLWSRPSTLRIEPGLRLELNAVAWQQGGYELHGRLHKLSSTLLPAAPFVPLRAQYRETHAHLGPDLLLVLHDAENGENWSMEAGMASYPEKATFAFQQRDVVSFELRFWGQRSRIILLGETLDDWINRTTVSFWMPQERGSVDLALSEAQMKEVLTPPAPVAAQIAK